jgi:hypothetical protein
VLTDTYVYIRILFYVWPVFSYKLQKVALCNVVSFGVRTTSDFSVVMALNSTNFSHILQNQELILLRYDNV